MADREVQYVAKQKVTQLALTRMHAHTPAQSFDCICLQTLLSLSKLSLLAAHGRDEERAELDNALYHIAYQQNIPKDTLEVREDVCICLDIEYWISYS